MGRERPKRQESIGTHGVADAKFRVDAKIRRERVEEALGRAGRGRERIRKFSEESGRSIRRVEF